MTTFLVCPLDGCLPPDNGTDVTKTNNVVPTASDAVQTASGVIGSASGTTIIVVTGGNFAVGQYVQIPSRGPERMKITGIATNTLTVTRSAKGETALATIALNDVVLTGLDVNGEVPHCPVCGTALQVYDATKVTTLTGVAAGSQHPVDVDKAYVVQTDSPEAQVGTSSTLTGQAPRVSHTFPNTAGVVTRGSATVTAETINATVGP